MRKRVFQNLITSVKIVAGEASTEYDESKITKNCIFVKSLEISWDRAQEFGVLEGVKQLDHCVCVKNRVYEKVCEDAVGKAWDGYGGCEGAS